MVTIFHEMPACSASSSVCFNQANWVAPTTPCAGGHIPARPARSGAAVDVLAISQLVVVQQRVIALRGEHRLQAILTGGIHRKKLFPVLLRIIIEQLRLSGSIGRGRRNWSG